MKDNTTNSGKQIPHNVHHWSGSPFAIGVQHGRALREQIRAEYRPALDEFVRYCKQSEAKVLDRLTRHLEPIFQQYVPHAVEEIHGLAQGGELSFEHAFFAATRDGLALPPQTQTEGECTAVVCGKKTTQNGEVLIGQTKDTCAPLERYHIMRFDYNNGRRSIVLNYPGWCANIGLTSHGLSFTGNSLSARDAPGETVPFSLVKRLALEKKSVAEVLACLRDMKIQPGCIMLADAPGHAVCLESAGGYWDMHEISGRAFGHANSVLSPNLKRFALPGHRNSELRQQRVQRVLDTKSGNLTPTSLEQIFADHTNYPYSICRHPAHDEPSSTTAAFIADLGNLEMRIAIGNPCTARFQTYGID